MGDIGARSSTEDSMNGDRQSRKEANTKIEPSVNPRKQIKSTKTDQDCVLECEDDERSW